MLAMAPGMEGNKKQAQQDKAKKVLLTMRE
jgi:hypothetical protein